MKSEIPKDMFSKPLVVGDFVVKATNRNTCRLVLCKVTKVSGKYAYVNDRNQPIKNSKGYIVVTAIVPDHIGKSIGISE